MDILRAPKARFRDLPDYPWRPHFVVVDEDDLRMHYIDEGMSGAPTIVMLHGEPSWSFLYRFMIARCVKAGFRVLAPDLIGFGRSDKFSDPAAYTYARHVGWVRRWIELLDLNEITLVGQDWGSLIGLRLVAELPDRFARVVIGNGMLPTGHEKVPAAFHVWRAFAKYTPVFPVAGILQVGTKRRLSRRELAAYRAPFPHRRHLAGARAFPELVPTSPEHPGAAANQAAWRVLEQWDKPFLTCFSDGDPITRGGDRYMQERIPGAKGLPHRTVRGGHFLQEDSPDEFSDAIIELIHSTS
ncbi:MAG: alpha/beta fold hydrolase [Candidatus Dadabacteria bacterium]|nr:MAG: alpha/beta fold hydrolase [Candidatus Dadabacteria bacterium]